MTFGLFGETHNGGGGVVFQGLGGKGGAGSQARNGWSWTGDPNHSGGWVYTDGTDSNSHIRAAPSAPVPWWRDAGSAFIQGGAEAANGVTNLVLKTNNSVIWLANGASRR